MTVLQHKTDHKRSQVRTFDELHQTSPSNIALQASSIIPQVYASLFCCFFLFLPNAATGNYLIRLDRGVFDVIYEDPSERATINSIMKKITLLGDSKAMMGISICFMAYGGDRQLETGRLLSSAFVGSGLVVYGLKEFVRRKRPLEDELGNPSFPSGHTAFAFTIAKILSSQYRRWRVPFYVGAGLVGLSRIWLGRHYPSDVLMGAVLGTVTGTVVLTNRFTLLSWEF